MLSHALQERGSTVLMPTKMGIFQKLVSSKICGSKERLLIVVVL